MILACYIFKRPKISNCISLDIALRLTGGTSRLEGKVEVLYQGIWGTICDDGWDDIDATVVCRELGFLNGTATGHSQFVADSIPVWLHQVSCFGNESKLSHCMHSGTGNTGNCSHGEDAGVHCNSHGSYVIM